MMPVNKEPCPFYEAASPRDALALSASLCGRSFRLLERGEGLAADRRGDGEKSSVSTEGARRGVIGAPHRPASPLVKAASVKFAMASGSTGGDGSGWALGVESAE